MAKNLAKAVCKCCGLKSFNCGQGEALHAVFMSRLKALHTASRLVKCPGSNQWFFSVANADLMRCESGLAACKLCFKSNVVYIANLSQLSARASIIRDHMAACHPKVQVPIMRISKKAKLARLPKLPQPAGQELPVVKPPPRKRIRSEQTTSRAPFPSQGMFYCLY